MTTIIESTIKLFFDKSYNNKSKTYKFITLMKVPLHQNKLWKDKTTWLIRNWQKKKNRKYIINVLLAYRTYPKEIKNACRVILATWKKELEFKITTHKRNRIDYGNHIKIALGHPNLTTEARETALQIIEANRKNQINIPNYLLLIAHNIVDYNEFPKWNI